MGLLLEFIYLVVTVVALLAVGWIMEKMGGFALIGVNRGIFFRGENREGKRLREGLTIQTSASVLDIMQALDTYVSAVEAPLGLSDVLYVSNRTGRGIAWVYGSAYKVKLEAVLVFATGEAETRAVFAVTRWLEEDGLVAAIDVLKTLQMQIVAAIQAADSEATITEGAAGLSELSQLAGAFAMTD